MLNEVSTMKSMPFKYKSQNKEEQIVVTREKSQWIVVQDYSHTYNTRIQLSRLQRIYQSHILTYD